MARKKRQFNAFSLSFLDIMSCGFGAVILFFVIINHATVQRTDTMNSDLSGEVMLLETELALEELHRVKLQNSLDEVEQEVVDADGATTQLIDELDDDRQELSEQQEEAAARRERLEQLISEVQSIEEQMSNFLDDETEKETGTLIDVIGEGNRQYLTGLRIGGERIMVLVDTSASMLDNTIVNILRRRNLPAEQRRRSNKWQRAVRTVQWLASQMPPESQFQVYRYSTDATPVISGTEGRWLDNEDGRKLGEAVEKVRQIAPEGGTRLHAAIEAINLMSPRPDNVYLIVDGLPTQGDSVITEKGSVDGRQRLRYFREAANQLSAGIPVNIIMLPMEGDPAAAGEYWQLAALTGGSFMSPTEDWP